MRRGLGWQLLEHPAHQGIQNWVRDLNRTYCAEPAMHQLDFSSEGFEWVDFHDADSSVIAFLRKSSTGDVSYWGWQTSPRCQGWVIGSAIPASGHWRELLNSDSKIYGGSGYGNFGGLDAAPVPSHGRNFSLSLTLPPLGIVYLKSEKADE